ncbi:MAG: bacteriorhodopsin [Wenzhouxiangellaceae bacterium]|nr:bacteriorhodopsin [Wenzhouxiangellaceae bacterium]
MNTFTIITQYSFLITMLGMAGGTVYFWLERDSIAPEFRPAATISGIYTGIAAFMYWLIYQQVGLDGQVSSVLDLPTHVRYIDWIVTTPLILITIGLMLQIQERKVSVLWLVVVADVAMIIFGYFGELYADAPGKDFEAWTMFGLGCLAYLVLLYMILQFFGEAADEKVGPVKRSFRIMALFIAVGWAIYPLGFVLGLVSDADGAKLAREFVYNIADLVNKVGLGLVVVTTAKAITKDAQIKEAMRDL